MIITKLVAPSVKDSAVVLSRKGNAMTITFPSRPRGHNVEVELTRDNQNQWHDKHGYRWPFPSHPARTVTPAQA